MLWKNKIKNALSLTKLMDANDPKFQQIKELLLCPIGFRMRKLRCSMWQSSGHCPCLLPLLLLSSELWHRKSTDGTLYRLTLIWSQKKIQFCLEIYSNNLFFCINKFRYNLYISNWNIQDTNCLLLINFVLLRTVKRSKIVS